MKEIFAFKCGYLKTMMFFLIFTISVATLSSYAALEPEIKKTYYPNGQVKTEVVYQEGKANGIARAFYDDGKLASETPYHDSIIEGTVKEYSPAGYLEWHLEKETPYKNGKKQGMERTYYPNGQCKSEFSYMNGEWAGVYRSYYRTGKIETEMQNSSEGRGLKKEYYESGKLKSEEIEKDGKIFILKRYFENGAVSETRDVGGKSLYYYDDGTPRGVHEDIYEITAKITAIDYTSLTSGIADSGEYRKCYMGIEIIKVGPLFEKGDAPISRGRKIGDKLQVRASIDYVKEGSLLMDNGDKLILRPNDIIMGKISTYYDDIFKTEWFKGEKGINLLSGIKLVEKNKPFIFQDIVVSKSGERMRAKIIDLTEGYMKVESNNNVLTYYHDDVDSPWSAVIKNARYFIVMGNREEACKKQVEFATEVSKNLMLDYVKTNTMCEDLMDNVNKQRDQKETTIMATGSNIHHLGYNVIAEHKKPVLFLDQDNRLKLGFYKNKQQAVAALSQVKNIYKDAYIGVPICYVPDVSTYPGSYIFGYTEKHQDAWCSFDEVVKIFKSKTSDQQ